MYVPTKALFGAGELNNLHKQALPGRRAMLVISNGKSTRANGYLARTEEQLAKAGVEYFVFDKVEANPSWAYSRAWRITRSSAPRPSSRSAAAA